MKAEGLRGGPDTGWYPGPPHVIERRHRDGAWLPVAVGIRARTTRQALAKYRACLPQGVWRHVTLRARLQEQLAPASH